MSAEKVTPKKGRGRPPILQPELVAAAIVEFSGNVSSVARKFGVSRTAVHKLITSKPSLQAILSDAREGILDDVESALHKAARAGEAWAVCFFLKTQGKARGYIERAEPVPQADAAAAAKFEETMRRTIEVKAKQQATHAGK